MKSSMQLEILAVAPPSTRMSKESESNRGRCAIAGPGLSQYARAQATPIVTAKKTIAVAWLWDLALWCLGKAVEVELKDPAQEQRQPRSWDWTWM
jgi:hypothetical protein